MKNYRGKISEKYDTMKFNKAGNSFDYVEEDLNERLYGKQRNIDKNKNGRIDSEDFKMLRNKKETKESMEKDLSEKLYGKQRNIDKNKNGRIDREDFKMLRNKKETKEGRGECMECGGKWPMEEETIYEFEVNESDVCECGGLKMEGECSECGMKESDLLEFKGDDYKDLSMFNPYYGDHEEECSHCNGTGYDEFNDTECEWCGGEGFSQGIDFQYEPKLEEDMFDNAKKTSDFWNDGEKTFRTKMYEYEIFNDKLGRTVRLSEEQVVNLIETLAEEKLKPSKKTRGYSEYERSFDKSGKENQDYYKEVSKKMKDYMKDGSKESFTMEPKHFPMGNGEIEEMDKMAYVPSDSVAEYVENFTAAALENIEYDEFAPNKEWVEDNVLGSSRTGNNPKWANAVETPTNKRRNEIREKNLLGQIKKKAYNKSPQPIVKDRPGSDDASDLLNKVESGEKRSSKKSKKINEDLERIGNLISYGRKTQ